MKELKKRKKKKLKKQEINFFLINYFFLVYFKYNICNNIFKKNLFFNQKK